VGKRTTECWLARNATGSQLRVTLVIHVVKMTSQVFLGMLSGAKLRRYLPRVVKGCGKGTEPISRLETLPGNDFEFGSFLNGP
jgi:hypothetical protein